METANGAVLYRSNRLLTVRIKFDIMRKEYFMENIEHKEIFFNRAEVVFRCFAEFF